MTKGTYHAIRRGEEWLVVFERAAEPMWLQVVARFRSEKRAECYADVENDMFDDDPADQWQADTRIAVPTMPEPASLIRAEWIVRPVTGALTARVETVTFGCEGPAATKHENPADLSTAPMSQNPAADEGEFDPAVTAEELTPQPKETAPDRPASKPEGIGVIDLRRKPESREAVWRAVAEIVKAGGKPTYDAIAAHADMTDGAVKTHVLALVADGTLKRIGERRTATLEVLRWPDGMEAGAPIVQPAAPVARAAASAARPAAKTRFPMRTEGNPADVSGLPESHDAVKDGRTLFPSTVVDPADSPRVLVSGAQNRKLGDRIVKGAWQGMPIFHLTLEERATCPTSCAVWRECYGNGMQLARRHRHGPDLLLALDSELQALNREHREGFAVRLHTLGDFYSLEYVGYWKRALASFENLHVFGYTAHERTSEIGAAVKGLTDREWSRFAIRFSAAEPKPQGTVVIFRKPEGATVEEGIVCPAETGATANCGSCGLCWADASREKTIVFAAHGRAFKQDEAELSAPIGQLPTAARVAQAGRALGAEPEPIVPATTTLASASVMDTFHAVAAEGDVPVRTMAGVSFADTLSDTRKAKFRDMWNDPRSTLASIAKAFGTIPEDAIATAHAMNLSARKGQADKSMKGLPHDPDQVAEFLRTRGVTRIETTAPPRPAGVPAMPTNPRRSI